MTKRLLEEHPAAEKIVVFANTGSEHPLTLQFIDMCDLVFGFGTVWIEVQVSPEKGRGARARVVNYDTASRDGAPFEAVIQKYGIPNTKFPHCTRELKERPIHSYLRSVGWQAGTYDTAIGLRADEIDRMAPDAAKRRLVYPLVRWGVKKADVLAWWKQQPFDLRIPEHFGNCVWCWKKSLRKHLTLAKETPEVFAFPRRMEAVHAHTGAGAAEQPRRFFRRNHTVDDIFALAAEPFERFTDPEFDLADGCADSCEVFS